MCSTRCIVCSVAAMILGCQGAWATVRPYSVELIDPVPTESGKLYRGTIEIATLFDAEVSGLRVEGKGWSNLQISAAPHVDMLAKTRISIPFEALPVDGADRLVFAFEYNGETVRKEFDLSPGAFSSSTHSRHVIQVGQDEEIRFPVVELGELNPTPRAVDGSRESETPDLEAADDPSGEKDSWYIRLYGRFVYTRSDYVMIGADGVTVDFWDDDSTWDDHICTTVTDQNGYFDTTCLWDPCFGCDGTPDIYVEFQSANSKVDVHDESVWQTTYSWKTGTWSDYDEAELNLYTIMPADSGDYPALHILNSLVRAWRWLFSHEGYDCPEVEGFWPDGSSGAWYTNDGVHISSQHQWDEAVHSHEYGHFWMDTYGVIPSHDYCNGVCDTDGCGHCVWCNESANIAWLEGWADWFADVMTRSYPGDYGVASLATMSMEQLASCGGSWHDPYITEGFLGALLRDIEDSEQDDHPHYPGYMDLIAIGTDEIFDVADYDVPYTPEEFINAFKVRFPTHTLNLWETGMNCGYDFDRYPPAAPTNLSSSHAVNVSSPDNTVDFYWTRALDDASGVYGYGISLSSGYFTIPDAVVDIGNVTHYVTDQLSPGSYYFCIRTLDRAGRWGDTFAYYGPVVISEPMDANLEFVLPPEWGYPVVPRATNDSTFSYAPAPASLPGNNAGTYWNVYGTNAGGGSAPSFYLRCDVDGVGMSGIGLYGTVDPGEWFGFMNRGPIEVRGGRHTFGVMLDSGEGIPETDETDNRWARQWVWTPLTLADADSTVTRSEPPDRFGGHADVQSGPAYVNCDGFRFNTAAGGGWWHAVSIRAVDNDADYDCLLHESSTDASSGFGDRLAWSAFLSGRLDAVISNRNVVGTRDYDVGVIKYGGTCDYVLSHTKSEIITTGAEYQISWAEGEMITLREFAELVGAGETSSMTIFLDHDPLDGPLELRWYDGTFETGVLGGYNGAATTDQNGQARLTITIDVDNEGWQGIAVYRDPKSGTTPLDFTLRVDYTPADMMPYHASGWHSPFVPTLDSPGIAGSVPLPETLVGNEARTCLNIAVTNNSPSSGGAFLAAVDLDGDHWMTFSYQGFDGYENSLVNSAETEIVHGGRHTLDIRLDYDGQLPEIYENNNVYGEQYVWSPEVLATGLAIERAMPGRWYGGLWEVTSGGPFYYNVDGLRIPGEISYWTGVAAMSGDSSDVDLLLYDDISSGAKSGFDVYSKWSGWVIGQSDFVLVNFNSQDSRPYDVGALGFYGDQNYTLEVVGSIYHGVLSSGSTDTVGPYSLGPNRILDLHEWGINEGRYTFILENNSGAVDWGISLHPENEVLYSKSSVVLRGMAWLNDPGVNEWFTVDLPAPQGDSYYCLGVWKVGSSDLPLTGEYTIQARTFVDCNTNDLDDYVELMLGEANDCNGNGLIDDCEAIVPGDFNGDSIVDSSDCYGFWDCVAGPEQQPDPSSVECSGFCLAVFDSDDDGDIDLVDFAAFQRLVGG